MSSSNDGAQPRRTGAIGCGDGVVLWRVWAPSAREVTLVLIDGDERRAELGMERDARGFHLARKPGIREGQRYAFRLDGGPEWPDPCSLWQPEGLDGPSAVVMPERFLWTDLEWPGVRRTDLVFYEIHVGTFTPEGTFEAIIPRLKALRELGVTAVEIMPVGQFPGSRNWGYDGVLPFAAQNTYGGPMGFQKLVDACHQTRLAIYLDVVYNHFGPESNYLCEFGPYYTDRYRSPWGDAINYDRAGSDAVREFVLANVGMWLEEFHVDGLRLDAADQILDTSARHILRAIEEAAEEAGERRGWPAIITAETDLNDPRLLYPPERGGYGIDAQWMDDYQHAFYAFLTGDRHGYYADFGKPEQLIKVLSQPYVFTGEFSRFRDRSYGARAEGLSGDRFVVFLQNHDQVGNRPRSDRLGARLNCPAKQRLAASMLLLSPYVPLLFMGEEYGEENPFPFFCSFRDEGLAKAVTEGRSREFHSEDPGAVVADPSAEATFAFARPSWSWPEGTTRAGLRRLHHDLLAARREWPALHDYMNRSARLVSTPEIRHLLELRRGTDRSGVARAYFNLDDRPSPIPDDIPAGMRVRFSSEAESYGGAREPARDIGEVLPHECIVFGPSSWKSFP